MIYGRAGVAPRVEQEGSATASWARTAHAVIEIHRALPPGSAAPRGRAATALPRSLNVAARCRLPKPMMWRWPPGLPERGRRGHPTALPEAGGELIRGALDRHRPQRGARSPSDLWPPPSGGGAEGVPRPLPSCPTASRPWAATTRLRLLITPSGERRPNRSPRPVGRSTPRILQGRLTKLTDARLRHTSPTRAPTPIRSRAAPPARQTWIHVDRRVIEF